MESVVAIAEGVYSESDFAASRLTARPRTLTKGVSNQTPSALRYVRHVFEIEADGVLHRVIIDGKKTEILRL